MVNEPIGKVYTMGKICSKKVFLYTKYFCSLKSAFCHSVNEAIGRFARGFVANFAQRVANEPIEKIYAMENFVLS